MNAASQAAVLDFVSALQVTVLIDAEESPLTTLERLVVLVRQVPSEFSRAHLTVLQSVLIVQLGRWAAAISPDLAQLLLGKIARLHVAPASAFRDRCLDLLDEMRRVLMKSASPDRRALDSRVITALQYVRAHCADHPLSLDEVARSVHVSRWHLEHLLKAQTGLPFKAHVRAARVEAACGLLRASTLSVKEVAARIGYRHVSELTRDFKAACHVTPRDWRRYRVSQAPGGR